MDLLKLIEEEVKKSYNGKILYLHGLGSSPKKDGISKLESDYHIISPKLNYSNKSMWDYVEHIIRKEKPIAVIGHSLGGYLAYYFSNKHKIPALMFNPAFKDDDLKLLPIPGEVKKIKPYKYQMAMVGSKDDVINPKDQKIQLRKGQCKIFIEEIGHDIPIGVLKKYYNKFVKSYLD